MHFYRLFQIYLLSVIFPRLKSNDREARVIIEYRVYTYMYYVTTNTEDGPDV